ncbi:MAG: DUF262 domain-containing protein [Holophagales bacterium]|jgi:hypothetical protein|nr:DUF262 domain-containing protein [Holophagales bacterium]
MDYTDPEYEYSDIKSELAADGSDSGVEAEVHAPYPFDVKRISIVRRQISLSNIVRRIKRGTIVAANIQRDENLWNEGQKSRLIESLMLKIPLPLFYVATDNDDVLTIVDGLQRINSIRQFIIENKYRLKELEYLDQLIGKDYASLPEEMKIRIEETELDFVIINPDSPPEIQRNIFRRLNTGGEPLTDQEIRHALYQGHSTNLLKNLANTKEFFDATDNKVNDSRMAGQELVLRCLAFSMLGVSEYRKNEDMDSFLSDAMMAINQLSSGIECNDIKLSNNRTISNSNISELKNNFILAMKRAYQLFGDYAFRISTPLKRAKTPINKSLFEVWSVILGKMPESQFKILSKKRNALYKKLDLEFADSTLPPRRSISSDSTKIGGVKARHEIIGNIVKEILGEK